MKVSGSGHYGLEIKPVRGITYQYFWEKESRRDYWYSNHLEEMQGRKPKIRSVKKITR